MKINRNQLNTNEQADSGFLTKFSQYLWWIRWTQIPERPGFPQFYSRLNSFIFSSFLFKSWNLADTVRKGSSWLRFKCGCEWDSSEFGQRTGRRHRTGRNTGSRNEAIARRFGVSQLARGNPPSQHQNQAAPVLSCNCVVTAYFRSSPNSDLCRCLAFVPCLLCYCLLGL